MLASVLPFRSGFHLKHDLCVCCKLIDIQDGIVSFLITCRIGKRPSTAFPLQDVDCWRSFDGLFVITNDEEVGPWAVGHTIDGYEVWSVCSAPDFIAI